MQNSTKGLNVGATYHVARNLNAATSGDQIGRPYSVLMFSHYFLGFTEGRVDTALRHREKWQCDNLKSHQQSKRTRALHILHYFL